MSVPKQVQASADAAEKLHNDLVNGDLSGKADKAPPENGIAPVVPPEGRKDQPPVNPNPIDPAQGDLTQKYKSLLGRCEAQAEDLKKIKSEKDVLYRQVSDLNRKVLQLEQELAESKQSKTEPENKDQNTSDGDIKQLNVDEIGQYGKEFAEMAKAINRVIAGQQVTKTPEPVSQQPQAPPRNTNTRVSMQQLESDLITDVYLIHKLDFNHINQAAEFMTWLKQYDPVSGQQHLLRWKEAVTVKDKDLCLQVINNFLGSPSAKDMLQRLGAKPNPTPAPNQQPNISTHTQDPATIPIEQGKVWYGDEILNFYTELTKANGKYAKNPEEAKRIEVEIQLAQKEGRVRPGKGPRG